MKIEKAVRTQQKFFGLIYGISGSGKTYSALSIAKGFGGKIAFINTEHNKPMQYAVGEDGEGFEFDIITLQQPFHPNKFIEAVELIKEANCYDTLIIDSITHAWEGEGGVLDIYNDLCEKENSKRLQQQLWQIAKKPHFLLMKRLTQLDMNIILCARANEDSFIGEKDKTIITGYHPCCEKRIQFEVYLTIFLENMKPKITKVNCGLKSKQKDIEAINNCQCLTEKEGKLLKNLLSSGVKQIEPEKTKDELKMELIEMAHNGTSSLQVYWENLTPRQRNMIKEFKDQAKNVAENAEKQNNDLSSKTSELTIDDNE